MEVERLKKLQTVIDCPSKEYAEKFLVPFLEKLGVNYALFFLGYEGNTYSNIFTFQDFQKVSNIMFTNRDIYIAKGFTQIFYCLDSSRYRMNIHCIGLLQAMRKNEIPIIRLDPEDTSYPFNLHRTLQIKGVTNKKMGKIK